MAPRLLPCARARAAALSRDPNRWKSSPRSDACCIDMVEGIDASAHDPAVFAGGIYSSARVGGWPMGRRGPAATWDNWAVCDNDDTRRAESCNSSRARAADGTYNGILMADAGARGSCGREESRFYGAYSSYAVMAICSRVRLGGMQYMRFYYVTGGNIRLAAIVRLARLWCQRVSRWDRLGRGDASREGPREGGFDYLLITKYGFMNNFPPRSSLVFNPLSCYWICHVWSSLIESKQSWSIFMMCVQEMQNG